MRALGVTIDPVVAAHIASGGPAIVPWQPAWWRTLGAVGLADEADLHGVPLYVHGDMRWGARQRLAAERHGVDDGARSMVGARGVVVAHVRRRGRRLTLSGSPPRWAPGRVDELVEHMPEGADEALLLDEVERLTPAVAKGSSTGLWELPSALVGRLAPAQAVATAAGSAPAAVAPPTPGPFPPSDPLPPAGSLPLGPAYARPWQLRLVREGFPEQIVPRLGGGSAGEIAARLAEIGRRVEAWWPGALAELVALEPDGAARIIDCAACGLPTAATNSQRTVFLAGAGYIEQLGQAAGVVCSRGRRGRQGGCKRVMVGAPLVCSLICERRILKAAGRPIAEALDPPVSPEQFFAERRLFRAAGDQAAAARRGVLLLLLRRRSLPHFEQGKR